jgi:hypothetical protein
MLRGERLQGVHEVVVAEVGVEAHAHEKGRVRTAIIRRRVDRARRCLANPDLTRLCRNGSTLAAKVFRFAK